jgi:hypothetical protein
VLHLDVELRVLAGAHRVDIGERELVALRQQVLALDLDFRLGRRHALRAAVVRGFRLLLCRRLIFVRRPEVLLVALEIATRTGVVLRRPQLEPALRVVHRFDQRAEPGALIVGEAVDQVRERARVEPVEHLGPLAVGQAEQQVERGDRVVSRHQRRRGQQAFDLHPVRAGLEVRLVRGRAEREIGRARLRRGTDGEPEHWRSRAGLRERRATRCRDGLRRHLRIGHLHRSRAFRPEVPHAKILSHREARRREASLLHTQESHVVHHCRIAAEIAVTIPARP